MSIPTTPEITSPLDNNPIKYVVVRGGHRVSDKEYDSPTDPSCLSEIAFWTKTSKRSSGEKVEAVIFEAKKHRVW